MSGFVGAVASGIAAALVQQRGSRLPAIVLFLPALWWKVPGAFGLIQLTRVAPGSIGGDPMLAVLFTGPVLAPHVVLGVAMAAALFGLTMFMRHPSRLRALRRPGTRTCA